MLVKPREGIRKFPRNRRQEEKHMAIAGLPEFQTESGERTRCSYRIRDSFPEMLFSRLCNIRHSKG